jgi:hypothetical protein
VRRQRWGALNAREEVVLQLPRGRVAVATEVRSSLIFSSLQSLRSHGLFDRYVSLVAPEFRDTILNSVAGVWLPMRVGVAHYQACEDLGIPAADQVAIGHEVGNRIQGSLVGMLLRSARGAGATPWTVLGQLDRLWDRVFRGGAGPLVMRRGPKEARVELIGLPLLGVPYFRHAYRGTFLAGLELFSNKVYVHEGARRLDGTAEFRVSWA